MDLETYGKSKPPDMQKLRAEILVILNRKVKGELEFVGVADLRRRVCNNVKAPSFFALLKEMEGDELLMVRGLDSRWARCAVWDHPKMVEWRIEKEKWAKEMEEIEKYHAEQKRQWDIENGPRLARERFQKEVAEFFVDNSDQLFEVVRRVFQVYTPKKTPWLHSRTSF